MTQRDGKISPAGPDALEELARAWSFATDAGHDATAAALAPSLVSRLKMAGAIRKAKAVRVGPWIYWIRGGAVARETLCTVPRRLGGLTRAAVFPLLAVAALAGAFPAPGCVPPGPVTPPPVVVTPSPAPAPGLAAVRAAVRVHLAGFVTTHRNLASQIRDEKGPQTNDQIIAAVATARAATGTRLGQVVDQAIRPLCNADGTFRDRAGVAAILDAVADAAAQPMPKGGS